MGQQQIVLVILGVVTVAIAIVISLTLLISNADAQNKLEIINDLNNLRAFANKFRMRPSSMAGGSGSYVGFLMPSSLMSNENASYAMKVGKSEITVVATSSATPTNRISVVIDSDGNFSSWTYSGDFQ